MQMAHYSPGRDRATFDQKNDPMIVLNWFHPYLTRHAADCMLIDNAPEGSYLLRASSSYDTDRSYVLSVKLSSSVQHIKVLKRADGYKFGNSTFQTVESFQRHFEVEKPVIGGDSGITVVLKFPYTRFISEGHFYAEVVHHAVTNLVGSTSESEREETSEEDGSPPLNARATTLPAQGIGSKEGYLTKQGRVRKNWKVRWFVLRNSTLSYYKNKPSRRPINRLDLNTALAVEFDTSKQKEFCFRVEFPQRTYFFHSTCAEDSHQWVEVLRSKLPSSDAATTTTVNAS